MVFSPPSWSGRKNFLDRRILDQNAGIRDKRQIAGTRSEKRKMYIVFSKVSRHLVIMHPATGVPEALSVSPAFTCTKHLHNLESHNIRV